MIKILIADDEALVRAGIKSLISWEKYGYEIIEEAQNGEEAYQKIVSLHPDILITDIKMPKMDGITLLRTLKENNISIASIILSCYDEFDLVREAMRYGAKDYLLKLSIDAPSLLAVLNEIKKSLKIFNAKSSSTAIDIQDLKDLFVQKLINKKFHSSTEIKNIIHNLKLNCELKDYRLIQFTLFTYNDNSAFDKEDEQTHILVNNILEQICKRQSCCELIYFQNHYLIIHKNSNLKNLQLQISTAMKEYLNATAYFGISSNLSDYTAFPQGIEESQCALECSIFYQNLYLTYFEEISKEHVPSFSKEDDDFLFSALLERNFSISFSICQKLIEQVTTAHYLKSECLFYFNEILSVYARVARKTECSIDFILENNHNIFELLQAKANYSSCMELFKKFTKHFISIIEEKKTSTVRKEILQIENYVKQHYSEEIDLNTISELLNMCPSHISNLFKKETGINFSSYLTKVRMDAAKQLLQNSDTLIYEIAESTGYSNSGYFGKVFKKFFGITPEEYKRKYCTK